MKRLVPFAKAIYDETEIEAVRDCLAHGWLGEGNLTEKFEKTFARYIGTEFACLVNSGSSANLLAIRALNLKEGDKVLTCAGGFPSTLNPIWHSHLQVVAVDIDPITLNIDLDRVEEAIEKEKPKAIIFAHTLGNPVDMDRLLALANKSGLQIVEDNCDALGSEFGGRKTGSFGDFSTCSFYASHHITLAGGGGIVTSNKLKDALRIKSLKEWGREQEEVGFEGDHGVYFDSISNGVPYDHRYSYSEMGYNFKVPEIMAAFGLVQMNRLEGFHIARRKNFTYLMERMRKFQDYFQYVEAHPKSLPSWFNFPVTLKDNVPFTRKELVEHLEKNGVRTRLFFGGNILKQSGFENLEVIKVGDFANADKVHRDSFLLGIHPSLSLGEMDYMVSVIENFIEKR